MHRTHARDGGPVTITAVDWALEERCPRGINVRGGAVSSGAFKKRFN
jgi:hypothetical protein